MPRRGENIRKRNDGRWEHRYIASYDLKGKAQYKSIYGDSYQEVKQKIQMKKQGQSHNKQERIVHLQGIPMEMLCLDWLEQVKVKLKQSTYGNYLDLIEIHIVPYFKGVGANAITAGTINAFIQAKHESGRINGAGGLSAKTIHDMVLLLKQILSYAERKKHMEPIDPEEIVCPKAQPNPLPVLSQAEQDRLVSYVLANTNAETIGILISLYTGIRLGELCALTWQDIDFQAGILHVTKTLQRIRNTDKNACTKTKIIIDSPKSATSIRTIPIPIFLLSMLKKLRKEQIIGSYVLGGKFKYIEPRLYQKKYKQAIEQADIADINFHALRHTFATRAIEQGFDIKSLSEILGHASVKFTLERYVHSSYALKKQHMEKLAVPS